MWEEGWGLLLVMTSMWVVFIYYYYYCFFGGGGLASPMVLWSVGARRGVAYDWLWVRRCCGILSFGDSTIGAVMVGTQVEGMTGPSMSAWWGSLCDEVGALLV